LIVCVYASLWPWHDVTLEFQGYYYYDYIVAPVYVDYPLLCFLLTTSKLIVGEYVATPSYHIWCVGVIRFIFHVLQLLASRFKVVLQ
jgi:hypothetical protein